MKISEVRKYLEESNQVDEKFIKRLLHSDKKGLRELAERYIKKQEQKKEKEKKKLEHINRLKVLENKALEKGYKIVAGIDEAGRGPLAGPVVASAVIMPFGCVIFGINDSKKVTPHLREKLYDEIKSNAISIGVGIASAEEIDTFNILEATKLACYRALEQLDPKPDLLLTDALKLDKANIPFWNIIKGDATSFTIAAASIIAKVTRDRIMEEYHNEYPHYNFKKHKGYGCAEHLRLLRQYGPSTLHRRTFKHVECSSNEMIRSNSFHLFQNEIQNANSIDELLIISDKIKTFLDFLPQCEISALRECYNTQQLLL